MNKEDMIFTNNGILAVKRRNNVICSKTAAPGDYHTK